MPHRLLINVHVVDDPKYAPFLQPTETVRGIPCKVGIRVKNLGEIFPGGSIKSIRFSTAVGGLRELAAISKMDIVIPKLENQQETTFEIPFIPVTSGIMSVSMNVETEDNEKIEYFQDEKGQPLDTEHSLNFIYVVERNWLDMVMLLRQLVEREGSK